MRLRGFWATLIKVVYEVRSPVPVAIRLSDALGRVVAHVVREAAQVVTHRQTIATGSFAPGVYVVVLESGTARHARLLVLAR